MKIPNYDTNTNQKESSKRRLNGFLDEDFRMVIAGQTRCGKTNTLMHILRTPLVCYDKIYIFSPNHHQDKLSGFQKLVDILSEKVGYPILEIGSEADILNKNEYPISNRKVIVFDDLVNANAKIQNKIANHFIDGRHHYISPIYLTQSYYDVPQKLRQNCSHVILYLPATKNHLNLIAKENLVSPHLFNKLGPYEFLFLDKEKKKITKNFGEDI